MGDKGLLLTGDDTAWPKTETQDECYDDCEGDPPDGDEDDDV